jgi:ACS family glucarate transporter-like MFS transporter
MLVVACGHFNRVGISVAGTERIIPDYGMAPEKMGLVYTAFLATYTLAMLPGGWFIDRFGARTALLLLGFSSAVFVALSGAVGFAFHETAALWVGLIVVRSLLGMVYAPLHPGSARMVADELPSDSRALANGWVTFAACLGIAATQLVLGALIDRFDWPAALLISSVMTLIVAMIWAGCAPAAHSPAGLAGSRNQADVDLSAVCRMLRQRSVILITLSYTAYGYFQYLFFYWISYYFETIRHEPPMVARRYTTEITLAMGVGMMCGGWLMNRVPESFSPWARRALVPLFGMFASGAIFEMGLIAASPRATLAAFVLSAAFLGTCEAAFWTTVVEFGGPYGATAAGLMNTGGNAGGSLSPYITPLLGGLIAERYGADMGWRLSLGVAGMIVFAGGALWLILQAPRSTEKASVTPELADDLI